MTFRVDHLNFCKTVFEIDKNTPQNSGWNGLARSERFTVVHSLACIVGNVRLFEVSDRNEVSHGKNVETMHAVALC